MKLKLITIFCLLFIITGCTTAPVSDSEPVQTEQAPVTKNTEQEVSLEELCQQADCRKNVVVRLRMEGRNIDDEMELFWPVIKNNEISVLPGEDLFIEADISDGKLINLKSVNAIENPEKTIQINFSQQEASLGMLLVVKNPFESNIKFNMQMMDFSGGLHETSSCPIGAGMSVYESWPHPIAQIFLINPRVITGDVYTCEY